VYVEPGRGDSAQRAEQSLLSAWDEGVCVVFFPEGTSTDGTQVLPFHGGLLAKVREDQQPVTAAYIHYSLTEDNGPNVSVEEDLCWSDTSLPLHMFRALGLRGVQVTLRFADKPMAFNAALTERKAAAAEARAAVLSLSPVRESITAD
jgi:1-acyl-sn-glycerol-3-phosphate acyltransferase